jgi:hypothetical protein
LDPETIDEEVLEPDPAVFKRLLEGQGGTQQQLHYLGTQLRVIAERLKTHMDRQREQHRNNSGRLEELETVVIKGNGEISLVRKIDRIQASIDSLLQKWEDKVTTHRWKIGEVGIPILAAVIAAALTGLIEHFTHH